MDALCQACAEAGAEGAWALVPFFLWFQVLSPIFAIQRRTSPLRWVTLLLKTATQLPQLQSLVWRFRHKPQRLHTHSSDLKTTREADLEVQCKKTAGGDWTTAPQNSNLEEENTKIRTKSPLWVCRAQSKTLRQWGSFQEKWFEGPKPKIWVGKNQSFTSKQNQENTNIKNQLQKTEKENILLQESLQALQDTRKKQEN